MIKKCTCKNEYQDKQYGIGNRVMNKFKDKFDNDVARCTVCGTVHFVASKGSK